MIIHDKVDPLLKEFFSKRHRPIILLSDIIYSNSPRELFRSIHKVPMQEEIDLLVNSPGGIANDAYKVATMIRKQCSGLNIFILERAKSAATILCLAGVNIYMSEISEMGPIDTQDWHPTRKGASISVLDLFGGLTYLDNLTNSSVIECVRKLREELGKDFPDLGSDYEALIRLAGSVKEHLVRPISEQIHPQVLGEHERLLKTARHYALLLMDRYETVPKKKRIFLAFVLAEAYSSHGFVIDLAEAQRIGFPAVPMEEDLAELSLKIAEELTENGITACKYIDPQQLEEKKVDEKKMEQITDNGAESKAAVK